ncbi:MAG TPA: DUF2878 domain-containing protein [bacterium]|nr:DUF2878 domain-containing protein [bacterium]
MIKLVTFLLFQGVWFTAILGAGAGYLWLGPLAALIFFGIFIVHLSEHPVQDAEFAGITILIGTVLDTLTARAGAFTYPQPSWHTFLAAPFMLALWPSFSLMMIRCIKWIRRRYVLGALFGAVGGPLSYWSGAKLGAVTLHESGVYALSLVAAEWAVATVLLLFAWERIIPETPAAEPVPTHPEPGDGGFADHLQAALEQTASGSTVSPEDLP